MGTQFLGIVRVAGRYKQLRAGQDEMLEQAVALAKGCRVLRLPMI